MIKIIRKQSAYFIMIVILIYFILGLLNKSFNITNWNNMSIDMLYMLSVFFLFALALETIIKKYY